LVLAKDKVTHFRLVLNINTTSHQTLGTLLGQACEVGIAFTFWLDIWLHTTG